MCLIRIGNLIASFFPIQMIFPSNSSQGDREAVESSDRSLNIADYHTSFESDPFFLHNLIRILVRDERRRGLALASGSTSKYRVPESFFGVARGPAGGPTNPKPGAAQQRIDGFFEHSEDVLRWESADKCYMLDAYAYLSLYNALQSRDVGRGATEEGTRWGGARAVCGAGTAALHEEARLLTLGIQSQES